MLISGATLFGKVDEVPGVMFVATRFLHAYYFPLWPTSSWIVRATTTRKVFPATWEGFQLARLHWGSVCLAWLRASLLSCLPLLALIGVTMILLERRLVDIAALGMAMLVAMLVLWLSYQLAAPRRDRLERFLAASEVPDEFRRRALQALGQRF